MEPQKPHKLAYEDSQDLSTNFRTGVYSHTSGRTESRSATEPDNSSVVEVLKGNGMDHLSSLERKILEGQLSMPSVKVSYFMLYRYATRIDALILIVSIICAMASGAVMPLTTIVFGQLGGSFQSFLSGSIPTPYFQHRLSQLTLYYLYLGIGQFITVYISVVGFMYTGENITQKMREQYLAAVLRQNIAIFDCLGAGEITTTITANMDLVLLGISEKVALCLTALTTFVTALIVGFVKNWRLSSVLLSVVFAVLFVMFGFSAFIVRYSKRSLDAYAPGSALAEEALTSVRTVTAFNGQEKLSRKFEACLNNTMGWGFKMKSAVGCMIGCMMLVTYLSYALGFWEGSRLLVAGHATLSETLTVLMALLTGAVSIAHAAPHVQAFAGAISAAGNIFKIIDRPIPENEGSDSLAADNVNGALEFRNIKHIYPSRPEVTVLQDFNLVVPAGKVTALVGSSGSGKSTIVGLVERFYTPVGGQVLLDGHDICTLNLKELRRYISLVSQEPVLFNCSISTNIEHGLIGTEYEAIGKEKKAELIVQAAKMANAHEFISRLPNGYDTMAGDRGLLLSGGQKQRIAIARAIVSNPKILLLDEATSALDSQSEGVVQAALDVASEGRTTIVIAHRLSTIRNADNIVVLYEGHIVEQGTHEELLLRQGTYWDLVEAQRLSTEKTTTKPLLEHLSDEPIPSKTMTNHGPQGGPMEKEPFARNSTSVSSLPVQTKLNAGQRDSLWTIFKVIAEFNRKETGIMVFGLFCSILAGGGMPVQGVLFAKCIISLSLPSTQYSQLRSDIDYWCLMYFIVALAIFILSSAHGIAFAYCSERLIYRARALTFRTLLRQEIAYFDSPANSAGSLTALLSSRTTDLAGISGAVLGATLQLITTIIAAITVSCIIGWKLALVCSSTIPILLLSGFARFWVLGRFQVRAQKAYASSASLACEAVSAISTVVSLTREQDVWNSYHNMLQVQLINSLRSILKTSLLYAASQSFGLFCMALGFWYGGRLIMSREYSMFQFFVCFSSVIFSAQSAGALFSFAPDMAKSREAAQQLKNLWDRKPEIDTASGNGERVPASEGKVEVRDVVFEYPGRMGQPVLQGLSFTVLPGQFVALVGASGCGKSTAIGLIERFYDPSSGAILVDGRNISTLNLQEYRRNIGLVSQEPVLYSGTVRENILFGVEAQNVSDDAIVETCKQANIHDFINSLPNGLSTPVGNKGTLLSGGQKQRLALARALIRNPAILLLDEATSALDSESEKVVQEALDRATRDSKRTTIAVAHRLSTVMHADVIFVLDGGRMVESGSHGELMRSRGRYWELARGQGMGA